MCYTVCNVTQSLSPLCAPVEPGKKRGVRMQMQSLTLQTPMGHDHPPPSPPYHSPPSPDHPLIIPYPQFPPPPPPPLPTSVIPSTFISPGSLSTIPLIFLSLISLFFPHNFHSPSLSSPTFPSLPLKEPKLEISVAEIFTQIRPVWLGVLGTRPKNPKC